MYRFLSVVLISSALSSFASDEAEPVIDPAPVQNEQATQSPKKTDEQETYAESFKTPNGILAVVNDTVITYHDIHEKLIPLVPQIRLKSRGDADFNEKIVTTGKQILERHIDDLLIVKEFQDRKGKIPSSYIEQHITNFIKENFQNDRAKYLAYLKSRSMSERDFKQEKQKEIVVDFVRSDMNRTQNEVSPKRIADFYKDNLDMFKKDKSIHLFQIMIAPQPGQSQEELLSQAKKAHLALKEGTPFTDVAKEFGTDDLSKSGGDWGWVEKYELRGELAQIAFNLESGQFSDPIPLDNHAFILMARDQKSEGHYNLAEVRTHIERILAEEFSQQAGKNKLERLRKRAYIKYFLDS